MAFAQGIAQVGQQFVVFHLAQIGHADVFGMALSTCRTRHHKRLFVAHKPSCHRRFDAHLVYGIHHKIHALGKQSGDVVFINKVFDGGDFTGRIDVKNPLLQGIDFGHAKQGCDGRQLAIDVGFGDVVQID